MGLVKEHFCPSGLKRHRSASLTANTNKHSDEALPQPIQVERKLQSTVEWQSALGGTNTSAWDRILFDTPFDQTIVPYPSKFWYPWRASHCRQWHLLLLVEESLG